MTGADRVFHCAGLVGDWLRPADARRVNVEGTRNVLLACRSAGVERVVHLSSLSVYGPGHHRGTDETAPLRYSSDTYADSKIDAERMVHAVAGDRQQVVIVRPGFIYGPGDRRFLPTLLAALASRQFVYVGDGNKRLNLSFVDDVADALLLAASTPGAAGQAYNLTDATDTTLRRFVELVCAEADIPPPTKKIPPPLAWAACSVAETLARARRSDHAPRLSRGRMRFLYYEQHYSADKAGLELGWRPRFTPHDGVPLTLAWCRAEGLLPAPPGRSRPAAAVPAGGGDG
jgi:2-alkyl-3-oxoalkanoate reductase